MKNEDRRLNRTERLFAEILLLQNRPSMSSRDLSDHFGVSRRTIFRDLRALSESGVPLTYGDEGGYEILEGYQLPPLMLSAREAATLLVGVDFMSLQSDPSLRHDAEQVGMKIRSVLPAEIRDYIDRLRTRTVLDPYWLHAVPGDATEEGQWYKLSQAVAEERTAIIRYHTPSRDEETKRQVDPLGLVYYTDHWNLIAFDHLREEVRNFRLDRIRELHVLTDRFSPPEGFELAKFVADRVGSFEKHSITVHFTSDAYANARFAVPARIDEETPGKDGTTIVFSFENLDYIARWVLRFGEGATVIKPLELINMVKARAKAVVERYG